MGNIKPKVNIKVVNINIDIGYSLLDKC